MGLRHLLVKAYAAVLVLNLGLLMVQGQTKLFQLATVNEPNLCLQIQQERGVLVPCQTEHSEITENTIFFVDKDSHENCIIQLFKTGKCLGYNSTTSNLCLSQCDKHEVIHWNINIVGGSVSEGSDNNCIYKDSKRDVSIHHCSDGFEKFKVLIVTDDGVDILKLDDLADVNQKQQLYPKPDPAKYLRGNLGDNLLGIKLFRYYHKKQPTMELEFVHKNFLLTDNNFSYLITHIHTNINYYSLQRSEAISKVLNNITQSFNLVAQYNIRYGSSNSCIDYNGLYCNFTTNRKGQPVEKYTQATINQLMQGFQKLAHQYPDYHEQVYYNKTTKANQWYLDYLYKSTGIHLYSQYPPQNCQGGNTDMGV